MNKPIKKILYLGLSLPEPFQRDDVIHYPIIKVIPLSPQNPDIQGAFSNLHKSSHLIFTSKVAVKRSFELFPLFGIPLTAIQSKTIYSVGRGTTQCLLSYGNFVVKTALKEDSEGLIDLIEQENLTDPIFFWPHSALSRSVITDYLNNRQDTLHSCLLYTTVPNRISPILSLDGIEEIVFTSPSCVYAYISIFGPLPRNIKLTPIGPITMKAINS